MCLRKKTWPRPHYADWATYCRRHKLKKQSTPHLVAANKETQFFFAGKDDVLASSALDKPKSRVYVLLGDSYVYVGITAKLRTRIKDHSRKKPFDNVFWLECPDEHFTALDVSMIEKGLFCLLKEAEGKDGKEASFEVLEEDEGCLREAELSELSERERRFAVGNECKPVIAGEAEPSVHYKSNKWLVDAIEGFYLFLRHRGYPLKSFPEKDVLNAMCCSTPTFTAEAILCRNFDHASEVELLLKNYMDRGRLCVFLGAIILAISLSPFVLIAYRWVVSQLALLLS